MNHYWLLITTWNSTYARFYTDQAEEFFPTYWPSQQQVDDAIAALLGCPL